VLALVKAGSVLLATDADDYVTARSFCHHFAFILSLWRMPK